VKLVLGDSDPVERLLEDRDADIFRSGLWRPLPGVLGFESCGEGEGSGGGGSAEGGRERRVDLVEADDDDARVVRATLRLHLRDHFFGRSHHVAMLEEAASDEVDDLHTRALLPEAV
jgi:hypothetical protein